MKVIYNLHRYLDIPYDLLMQGRESYEFEEFAKKELEANLNRAVQAVD